VTEIRPLSLVSPEVEGWLLWLSRTLSTTSACRTGRTLEWVLSGSTPAACTEAKRSRVKESVFSI